MTPAPVAEQVLACDHAWVDGRIADRVVLTIRGDRISEVLVEDTTFDDAARRGTHLRGVLLPGLVNAHSHAFHRALRGRTHAGEGTFWTWREQMYRVAGLLDPDSYQDLATAVFGEMLLAGITCVGEFHYLHHRADGGRYADPNAMGLAMLAAAAEVGIRITLLDTLYLTADVGRTVDDPGLAPVQERFSDGTAAAWLERIDDLLSATDGAASRVGAALHSVRAAPVQEAATAVAGVASLRGPDRRSPVLHAHVAEQPAEVKRCREVHGMTPVAVLDAAGAVDDRFTAVHGVWLDEGDITTLGRSSATVCACPTTERDLADGVVPADRLLAAGAGLSLGSDQHAVIDLLEEARAVELDLRLTTQVRGSLPPSALLEAATTGGARSLGWEDAGQIRPGALADLCVVGLDSVRMAGMRSSDLAAGIVFAATAADITHTMVGGRMVVADGRHVTIDVPDRLRRTIAAVDSGAQS